MLKEFVDSLRTAGIIAQKTPLAVVTIDSDVLLCNVDLLRGLTSDRAKKHVIDASSHLKTPRVMSSEESTVLLEKYLGELQDVFERFDISCKTKHRQTTNPELDRKRMGPNEQHGNHHDIDACQCLQPDTSVHRTPVVDLLLPPTNNRTTMFGLLLGYPVIYWYRTEDETDPANAEVCLDFVPLRVYTVAGKLISTDVECQPHTIYSFSCPEEQAAVMSDTIKNWLKTTQRVDCSKYFSDISMTYKCISLAKVAL